MAISNNPKAAVRELITDESFAAYLSVESIKKIEEFQKKIKHETLVIILELTEAGAFYGIDELAENEIYYCIKTAIQEMFGPNMPVIKLSASQYLFLLEDTDKEKARQILQCFSKLKFPSLDRPLMGSPKIGVAVHKPDALICQSIKNAYKALSHADHIYSKMRCFEDIEDLIAEDRRRVNLASSFAQAIEENRLRLAFQPVVSSKTGAVRNHECLLRILTEDEHIISVGPFIPIVERMGFIDEIDHKVLEMVYSELKANSTVKLGMNVSNISVSNSDWLDRAKFLLKDYQLAKRLTIEITETGDQQNLEEMGKFVDTIKSLGCSAAIDDFGSGYTSFKQLKFLHADVVKIDGLFIRDIVDNDDNKLFVKTLITFAKGFGIETVAEFVENGEVAKALMSLGVDYMQGNYFSPAVNYKSWEQSNVSE